MKALGSMPWENISLRCPCSSMIDASVLPKYDFTAVALEMDLPALGGHPFTDTLFPFIFVVETLIYLMCIPYRTYSLIFVM